MTEPKNPQAEKVGRIFAGIVAGSIAVGVAMIILAFAYVIALEILHSAT